MDISLKGKAAIITGAERGVGAAIARHFASLGCSVALIGRNAERLSSLAKDCVSNGLDPNQVIELHYKHSNLPEEKEVSDIFQQAADKLGPIHILVNGVSAMSYGRLSDITPSSVMEAFELNVMSAVIATKVATPLLKQTKGAVINISSTTSKRTTPGLLGFSMAGASLDYFTQTAAKELAADKIRVNAVSPAVNIFESLSEKVPTHPYQEFREPPLVNSPPTIDDVTKTAAFLASDESLFISGENICVDNGLHIAPLPLY